MGPVAHLLPALSPALLKEASQVPWPLTARHGKAATAQTRRRGAHAAVCMVAAAPPERTREAEGHSALDLGAVGDLAPQQMAQLLRLAHIRSVYNMHAACTCYVGRTQARLYLHCTGYCSKRRRLSEREFGSLSCVTTPCQEALLDCM